MADKPETWTVQQSLASTLESVDEAEQLALDVARQSGFEEEDLHRIGMAVRECVVNAVVHGNRYSAHKKVGIAVSRTPGRYSVRITDEGDGFDLHDLPNPLTEDNLLRNSGRGIFLARAFMDDFQVRRLAVGGTEVVLVKNVATPS